MWCQQESFYLQVLSPAPAIALPPTLIAGSHSGNTFSVRVATASGFTYYLESSTNLPAGNWTSVSQTPGDGSVKTLTDNAAADPQRFYRVRVQ